MQGVIPARFLDVSDFRPVPDNQEVLADGDRDQSIIIELLERAQHVPDAECASWFFHDLAGEMSAGSAALEGTRSLAPEEVPGLDPRIPKYAAVGSQLVAKYREGPEASNLVKVRMAVIRLGQPHDTDILITLYEPLAIRRRKRLEKTLFTLDNDDLTLAQQQRRRELWPTYLQLRQTKAGQPVYWKGAAIYVGHKPWQATPAAPATPDAPA
eukprot:jgi/Mesvir1/3477/Mv11968-RA.1